MNPLEVGNEYDVEIPNATAFRIRVDEVSGYMVLAEITRGVFCAAGKPSRRAGDGVWLSTLFSGIKFIPVG